MTHHTQIDLKTERSNIGCSHLISSVQINTSGSTESMFTAV